MFFGLALKYWKTYEANKAYYMAKTIHDLTKEDWNRLFPIEIVEHNPEWKRIYEDEKKKILKTIGKEYIVRIEHFGSTSIPSIKSKPYIDIIIEVLPEQLFDQKLIDKFKELDYFHFVVPARENVEAYSSFGKGYNLEGKNEQIFHIHMCPKDNFMWKQIHFRDYLNSNEKRAKEYEMLKLTLASKYRNDRGAYVLGKTDFINTTLDRIHKKQI